MSLKDLISTLIESAFTSKKVFIANTSAPNWTGKITIYNGTSANSVTQTLQRKLEQKTRQTYRREFIYQFEKVISLMCTSITRIQLRPFLNLLRPSALLSFAQEVCHG